MKITSAKQLSVALRNERKSAQCSQTVIANKTGLRQDTVSSFENNPESTKLETLFRILAALDLELEVHPRKRPLSDDSSQTWQEEW